MSYTIKFDRNKCRGCGACTLCDNWQFDSDGKVSPVETDIDEIGCNQDAADACPMSIIEIIEK